MHDNILVAIAALKVVIKFNLPYTKVYNRYRAYHCQLYYNGMQKLFSLVLSVIIQKFPIVNLIINLVVQNLMIVCNINLV